MSLMKEKGIFAVPTFAIFEYFARHAEGARAAREKALLDYKIAEFKKQVAAGVEFAVGSDVGPFPHGTQAVEMELMVRYGMKPAAVLQADLLHGAKLLGWEGQIGELKPGFYADVVAVPGNPLEDISVTERVKFVMKGGVVVRQQGLGFRVSGVGSWVSGITMSKRRSRLANTPNLSQDCGCRSLAGDILGASPGYGVSHAPRKCMLL
jgi:imidazolonepropionase-like amidohydrolase